MSQELWCSCAWVGVRLLKYLMRKNMVSCLKGMYFWGNIHGFVVGNLNCLSITLDRNEDQIESLHGCLLWQSVWLTASRIRLESYSITDHMDITMRESHQTCISLKIVWYYCIGKNIEIWANYNDLSRGHLNGGLVRNPSEIPLIQV